MSVERIEVEGYKVRTAGPCPEWAHIFVREWTRARHDGIAYGGEIAIHGSFGTYAYTWTHCCVSFKQFLIGVEFHYFMEKASPQFKEFDFDGSLANIREAVLRARRIGDIDRRTAAVTWEGFDDIRSEGNGGAHKFVSDLYDIEALRRVTQEPYEFVRERPTAACTGFWRELWPPFIDELKREVAAQPAKVSV